MLIKHLDWNQCHTMFSYQEKRKIFADSGARDRELFWSLDWPASSSLPLSPAICNSLNCLVAWVLKFVKASFQTHHIFHFDRNEEAFV